MTDETTSFGAQLANDPKKLYSITLHGENGDILATYRGTDGLADFARKFAYVHDGENAAIFGEPNPWDLVDLDNPGAEDEFERERIADVLAGLDAAAKEVEGKANG